MGFLSAIGRAAPLVAAGVAAGWYLRRQGLLGGRPQSALPPPPMPHPGAAFEPAAPAEPAIEAAAGPVIESTAEEAPEPDPAEQEPEQEPEPEEQESEEEQEPEQEHEPESDHEPDLEQHLDAVAAVSDAADVTAVVEDLLAAAPGEITDAEVVDEEAHPDDPEIAAAVRLALAGEPGLLSGSVDVDVVGGTVWLRGELTRPADIERAARRAGSVRGIRAVRNELQLPGAAPPDGPENP